MDARGCVVHDVSDPTREGAVFDFGTFMGGVAVGAFLMWMLRDYSLVRRRR